MTYARELADTPVGGQHVLDRPLGSLPRPGPIRRLLPVPLAGVGGMCHSSSSRFSLVHSELPEPQETEAQRTGTSQAAANAPCADGSGLLDRKSVV